MTSKVKVESVLFTRLAAKPTVSSEGRGRSLAGLVASRERTAPETVSAKGISSAALRAGEYIRSMRKAAGLSQAALARAMNVTQARISELEAGLGVQGPTWDVMERVSTVCGTHISFEIPTNPVLGPPSYAKQVFATLTAGGVTDNVLQIGEIKGIECITVNIRDGSSDEESDFSIALQPVALYR